MPYSNLIFLASSIVRLQLDDPPAPKVTLMKSGWSSERTSKVASMFDSSASFFGGKISKERLLFFL